MAGADGSAPDHLNDLRALAPDVRRFGFFALLRRLEARARGLPRISRSRAPAQNIVDLAHEPTMEFPAATLHGVEPAPNGRMRLRSLFLGLTGSMGALPLHLTEYAFYERRAAKAQPFGRFLDLLTDRMLQFFYRAWADSQPAVQADRPDDDRFAGYVSALIGAGQKTEAFNPLHYAGAFTSRRSPAVLMDALSDLLGVEVRIEEFVVRWRTIEPHERSRIGVGAGFNRLGVDALLGGSVCVAEDTFRVIIKADSIEDYRRFLPGRPSFDAVRKAIDALKPAQLDWQLQLELDERQAPPVRLDGTAPLGMASWLAPQGRNIVRADARIIG